MPTPPHTAGSLYKLHDEARPSSRVPTRAVSTSDGRDRPPLASARESLGPEERHADCLTTPPAERDAHAAQRAREAERRRASRTRWRGGRVGARTRAEYPPRLLPTHPAHSTPHVSSPQTTKRRRRPKRCDKALGVRRTEGGNSWMNAPGTSSLVFSIYACISHEPVDRAPAPPAPRSCRERRAKWRKYTEN